MNGLDPDVVYAISYVSLSATELTPSGVLLKSVLDFGAQANFFPDGDKVFYLSDWPGNSLSSTTLSDMKTNAVFTFAGSARSVSMNSDRSAVAWIDRAGAPHAVALAGSDSATRVDFALDSGDTATKIEIESGQVLVLTASKNAILFASTGGAPELKLNGVSVAALDADGSRFAYLKSDGTLAVESGLGAGVTAESGDALKLESPSIRDLGWTADGRVSYWTTLASGGREVRVADLATHQEISAASLSLSDSVGEGVVCPSFDGNTVYFSDLVNGEYVIRASAQGSEARTIAVPPEADEGLVCPKLGGAL
jgi:hypothetical protein